MISNCASFFNGWGRKDKEQSDPELWEAGSVAHAEWAALPIATRLSFKEARKAAWEANQA